MVRFRKRFRRRRRNSRRRYTYVHRGGIRL